MQNTQRTMLVLLPIISCYIISFKSNKDDVQNTSRMRDGLGKYGACQQSQIPKELCNLIYVVVVVK